jgi:phage N-6-adenine-methyltransferase
MNTNLMFSSETYQWSTPQEFFDKVNAVFNFTLDVCADAENAKFSNYFIEADDGLTQEWNGTVWMNPPYAKYVTEKWVKKAYQSARNGATVVCLLPARTDTIYWHEFCAKGEVFLLKGRLKFGDSKEMREKLNQTQRQSRINKTVHHYVSGSTLSVNA